MFYDGILQNPSYPFIWRIMLLGDYALKQNLRNNYCICANDAAVERSKLLVYCVLRAFPCNAAVPYVHTITQQQSDDQIRAWRPSWSQFRVKCWDWVWERLANVDLGSPLRSTKHALVLPLTLQDQSTTKMCIIRCLGLPASIVLTSAPVERMKQRYGTGTSAPVPRCTLSLDFVATWLPITSRAFLPTRKLHSSALTGLGGNTLVNRRRLV